MRKISRDEIEVAIAGIIGLVTLLAGSYLLDPPRVPVKSERPVKSLQELLPPASHWYDDACTGGKCDVP